MAIILTEKAAAEIKRVRDEQKLEDDMFLRIGVAGGGCSGRLRARLYTTARSCRLAGLLLPICPRCPATPTRQILTVNSWIAPARVTPVPSTRW